MTDWNVDVDGFERVLIRGALTPEVAAWDALRELEVDLTKSLFVEVLIKASISPKKEHRFVMFHNLGEVPNFSCANLDSWWLDGTFESWIKYRISRSRDMQAEVDLNRKVIEAALTSLENVSGVTK